MIRTVSILHSIRVSFACQDILTKQIFFAALIIIIILIVVVDVDDVVMEMKREMGGNRIFTSYGAITVNNLLKLE